MWRCVAGMINWLTLKMKGHVPSKRREPLTQRHGVTSKKTEALDYKCFINSYFGWGSVTSHCKETVRVACGYHSWASFDFKSHWLLSRVLLMRCYLVTQSCSCSYMIYKFLIRVTGRFMTSVIFISVYCSSRRWLCMAETYMRMKWIVLCWIYSLLVL